MQWGKQNVKTEACPFLSSMPSTGTFILHSLFIHVINYTKRLHFHNFSTDLCLIFNENYVCANSLLTIEWIPHAFNHTMKLRALEDIVMLPHITPSHMNMFPAIYVAKQCIKSWWNPCECLLCIIPCKRADTRLLMHYTNYLWITSNSLVTNKWHFFILLWRSKKHNFGVVTFVTKYYL